ncbi:hypothetical protein SAMN05443575_1511 [Jatrophihabitans endophyticus]|uniref:Uncharacterized protein n=1 Tax=Jatrophihabitans endophyticus TaxID=1206085 RepID=A0A1M5HG74_9ACTN|nr:hypothetical protein SAMN05443575_1511 [Jatrophihabitans endophyticus]
MTARSPALVQTTDVVAAMTDTSIACQAKLVLAWHAIAE